MSPNRPRPHTLLPLLLLLALSPWSPNTALGAPERIALVIGNAAYTGHAPLVNTLNDACDMSAKLRDLGFTVITVENADQRRLGRVVSAFLRRLRGSDAFGLLYYSGHGMQVDGENYLVPVDARIEDEPDISLQGLPLHRILAGMGDRGPGAVNLVLPDACRNNPFKIASGGRSHS